MAERSPMPAWDRPDWYVLRGMRRILVQRMQGLGLGRGSRVLDFGCGMGPYRALLPGDATYCGADLAANPQAHLHVAADGTLPATSGQFDLVLSTQVLEHALDPRKYLGEAWRVLKPGGHLLLSTHGMWRYHPDPVDYWRWTGPGLEHELARAGFALEQFDGVMGLAAVAVQTFQDATLPRLPAALRKGYGVLLQRLVAACDRLETAESRRLNAMVFVALARRPAP